MKRLILILLIMLLPIVADAQQWNLSLTSGKTLPNKPEWNYIAGPSYGLDASLRWQMSGSQLWHQRWHYPTLGFRFNYSQIAHGIAGNRWGLGAFVINPMWTERGKGTLSWELDLGLSCYSNPYSRYPNPDNHFIGSYLNCLIHAGFEYRMPLSDGNSITLAAKLVHSSNGYLQKPNQGLNFIQVEMGYQWGRTPNLLTSVPEDSSLLSDYHYLSYSPGWAQPRWGTSSPHRYYCHTLEAAMMWRTGERLAWGCGLDISYNYSQTPLSRHHKDLYSLPFYIGNFVSIEPYWGPLSIRASLGAYILRSRLSAVISLPFYERVGAYYHFSNGLFAGVSMRAYAAHVDYIEWTLGYQFFNS